MADTVNNSLRASNYLGIQLMPPTAAGKEGGSDLGITCPPDRVPQTPAGGLRPPAPPAEELRMLKVLCVGGKYAATSW